MKTYAEMFRFVFVGILATGITYGVYYLLMDFFSLNIAYAIGYLLGFICNFFLSAHFTFKRKPTIKNGLGFTLSNGINFGLHLLLLNFFLYLSIPDKIAPLPVFAIAIPINFLLVRFVFKSDLFNLK